MTHSLGRLAPICLVAVLWATGCQHLESSPMSEQNVGELESLLAATPRGALLPELETCRVAELAETAHGAAILAWARQAADTTGLPETTYTRYRTFEHKGTRQEYSGPYYEKRALLAREVVAAWLGDDASRIDRINDLIWSICEETNWVVPAHEKSSGIIDLFCAETAVNLAHALLLLEDRLPEEIHDRVRAEIKTRVMDPYLDGAGAAITGPACARARWGKRFCCSKKTCRGKRRRSRW